MKMSVIIFVRKLFTLSANEALWVQWKGHCKWIRVVVYAFLPLHQKFMFTIEWHKNVIIF